MLNQIVRSSWNTGNDGTENLMVVGIPRISSFGSNLIWNWPQFQLCGSWKVSMCTKLISYNSQNIHNTFLFSFFWQENIHNTKIWISTLIWKTIKDVIRISSFVRETNSQEKIITSSTLSWSPSQIQQPKPVHGKTAVFQKHLRSWKQISCPVRWKYLLCYPPFILHI